MKTRPKRRVHPQVSCAALPKPRRSIPVAEVNDMLEHQANRLIKEPTPYDERLQILNHIQELENEFKHHSQFAKSLALQIETARTKLKSINQLIADELDFDAVR